MLYENWVNFITVLIMAQLVILCLLLQINIC